MGAHLIDYVQAMIDRYKAMDPDYGSQQHQRDFMARVVKMQEIEPCMKDHDSDTPPEHKYSGNDACYSEATRQLVYKWSMK